MFPNNIIQNGSNGIKCFDYTTEIKEAMQCDGATAAYAYRIVFKLNKMNTSPLLCFFAYFPQKFRQI